MIEGEKRRKRMMLGGDGKREMNLQPREEWKRSNAMMEEMERSRE